MGGQLSETSLAAVLRTETQHRSADDPELAKRMVFILKELKKVQDKLGDGYLSAFPTEHFDRLQNLQQVWAPFYVVRSQATLNRALQTEEV